MDRQNMIPWAKLKSFVKEYQLSIEPLLHQEEDGTFTKP